MLVSGLLSNLNDFKGSIHAEGTTVTEQVERLANIKRLAVKILLPSPLLCPWARHFSLIDPNGVGRALRGSSHQWCINEWLNVIPVESAVQVKSAQPLINVADPFISIVVGRQ